MKLEKNEHELLEKSLSTDLDSSPKRLVRLESISLRLLRDLRYELSKEISRLTSRRESALDCLLKPTPGRFSALEGQNNYCLKEICSTCRQILQRLEDCMRQ